MTRTVGFIPRILVVEDVQETRDAIESLLTRDGYYVDPAQSEGDAVERGRWNRPDLILVSLGGLPDEVISIACRIRVKAGLSTHVPIVIFSIWTIQEGEEREIGENIYVTIPDNFDQLRKLLARVLKERSRPQ
jgi:DNA-binding response OmpR family regulator